MINKNKLSELFDSIDELLFYLDGCVISKKVNEFKSKYNQIRKELKGVRK